MTVYRVQVNAEVDVAATLAKAKKVADRVAKKGLAGGFKVTVETETVETDTPYGIKTETKKFLVFDGEPAKFNGYTFVAKVEFENDLPVVTGSPYYEGPSVDRDALVDGKCDECGKKVYRKFYVVVEDEAGNRLQVGSTCVKDFLGINVTASFFNTENPFDGFGGVGTVSQASVSAVLKAAAAVIKKSGFVKSGEDGATKNEVAALLGFASGKEVEEALKTYGFPTEEDAEVAAQAFKFGKALTDSGVASDWAWNVAAVLNVEDPDKAFVGLNRFGLLVSVVGVWFKNQAEKATEEAADGALKQEVFAEKGAKIEVKGATVTNIVGFNTVYGFSEIVFFVADGFQFKWFTSARPEGLTSGKTVDFKATVKGKDEYKGQVSTAVLRVKVTA